MKSVFVSKLALIALFSLLNLVAFAQEIEPEILIGDPNVSTTGRARITGKYREKRKKRVFFLRQ